MSWFRETLHGDFETGLKIDRELYRSRTDFQDVLVFENSILGRVLVLDGTIQTTERDEAFYHEMLTHPALNAHGTPRDVLIVGGGDGGVLREVLKHDVARATMVELDPQVVSLSREYLPSLSAGAFDDPRTEVIYADAAAYVAETDRRFDVVLVDSPDPIGPAAVLFGADFYADCRRLLRDDGFLVTQNGVPFLQTEELTDGGKVLGGLFTHTGFYFSAVPLYTGGDMAFGWASQARNLAALPVEDVGFETHCYNAATHRGAFATPPWIARALAGSPAAA
ncbi:MAG: polyamine aminopropyltransferase [Alphaproteobacteria bacterium]